MQLASKKILKNLHLTCKNQFWQACWKFSTRNPKVSFSRLDDDLKISGFELLFFFKMFLRTRRWQFGQCCRNFLTKRRKKSAQSPRFLWNCSSFKKAPEKVPLDKLNAFPTTFSERYHRNVEKSCGRWISVLTDLPNFFPQNNKFLLKVKKWWKSATIFWKKNFPNCSI